MTETQYNDLYQDAKKTREENIKWSQHYLDRATANGISLSQKYWQNEVKKWTNYTIEDYMIWKHVISKHPVTVEDVLEYREKNHE